MTDQIYTPGEDSSFEDLTFIEDSTVDEWIEIERPTDAQYLWM